MSEEKFREDKYRISYNWKDNPYGYLHQYSVKHWLIAPTLKIDKNNGMYIAKISIDFPGEVIEVESDSYKSRREAQTNAAYKMCVKLFENDSQSLEPRLKKNKSRTPKKSKNKKRKSRYN